MPAFSFWGAFVFFWPEASTLRGQGAFVFFVLGRFVFLDLFFFSEASMHDFLAGVRTGNEQSNSRALRGTGDQ